VRIRILLIPFLLIFGQTYADRLAVDQTAAKYRTGIPDPKSISVPADLQASVFKDPEKNLPRLVHYLTEDTNDHYLKAKRLHDWITDNIAYDTDLLLGLSDEGSRKVNELLALKRTTCGGFAGLFQQMAQQAGLESQPVTGLSKSCWIKKAARDCRHVWNAVKIGGKWHIVDSTADNRMSYKFGAFSAKRKYSDKHFLQAPEAKLLLNLPLEERQQFVSPTWSKEQFQSTPRVTVHSYEYDMRYTNDSAAKFKTGRRDFEGGYLEKLFDTADVDGDLFELRIRSSEQLLLFPQLVFQPQESFDDSADAAAHQTRAEGEVEPTVNLRAYSFCYRETDIICQFSPPRPGVYKAYIHAKKPGDASSFDLVHAFTLRASRAGSVLPRAANTFYANAALPWMGAELLEAELTAGDFPMLEFRRSPETFLSSSVMDQNGKNVPATVEASFPAPDRVRFYYKFAAPGTYWIRVFTRTPNQQGAPQQNVGIARMERSAASGPFPPVRELFYTRPFLESGIRVKSHESSEGIYTLSLVSQKPLGCSLKDLTTGKFVPMGCALHHEGENYTIDFRAPANGSYSAAVTPMREENEERLEALIRFRIADGGGEILPRAGLLHLYPALEKTGVRIVAHNVRPGKQAEAEVRLEAPEHLVIEAWLTDSAGRRVSRGGVVTRTGSEVLARFTAREPGKYAARILVKGPGQGHVLAAFRLEK
jgi:hypothetical protein